MRRSDIRVGGMYEMSAQSKPGRGKYRKCKVEVLRIEGEAFIVAARSGMTFALWDVPKDGDEFVVPARSLLRPWEDAERQQRMEEALADAHNRRYQEDRERSHVLTRNLAALGFPLRCSRLREAGHCA